MYGSIYLVVKDFDKSLDFYEKLFRMKVSAMNGKRFAIFNTPGLNLCLMNGYYDEQHPEEKETKGPIFEEYDDMSSIANATNSRKIFINLGVKPQIISGDFRRLFQTETPVTFCG